MLQERSGAFSAYARAYEIILKNPVDGVPSAIFKIEEFTSLDDGTKINKLISDVVIPMNDPNVAVDLYDPETDQPLGAQLTYGQIYVFFYSALKNLLNQE